MTLPIETTGSVEPTETTPLETLKSHYTVGVKENGDLVFDFGGDGLGVIELLGLHHYAGIRIKSTLDISNGTGDGLIVQLGNVLNVELEKVWVALENLTKELRDSDGAESEQQQPTEA